jgi:hypothetical protein
MDIARVFWILWYSEGWVLGWLSKGLRLFMENVLFELCDSSCYRTFCLVHVQDKVGATQFKLLIVRSFCIILFICGAGILTNRHQYKFVLDEDAMI